MTATDKKINALKPGQSVKISGDNRCWMTAERSGDGKTLRFVRHTRNSSRVFRTVSW